VHQRGVRGKYVSDSQEASPTDVHVDLSPLSVRPYASHAEAIGFCQD
jgi:hypothetical protein